ncbi:hypothetical protein V6N13_099978 [Hibiscus sabdariffa]
MNNLTENLGGNFSNKFQGWRAPDDVAKKGISGTGSSGDVKFDTTMDKATGNANVDNFVILDEEKEVVEDDHVQAILTKPQLQNHVFSTSSPMIDAEPSANMQQLSVVLPHGI